MLLLKDAEKKCQPKVISFFFPGMEKERSPLSLQRHARFIAMLLRYRALWGFRLSGNYAK